MKTLTRVAVAAACLFGSISLSVGASADQPSREATRSTTTSDEKTDAHVSAAVDRALVGQAKGSNRTMRVIVSFATRGTSAGPSVAAVRTARSNLLSALPAATYTLVADFDHIPAVSLEIGSQALDALRHNPQVLAVNEDRSVKTTMTEANALTGVAAVHTAGITGDGVTVGIIDTGIDSNGGVVHPALADDVVGQQCFRTENDCAGGVTSAEDFHGHGTHVAGIITGPQGVAPDANVYALKVFTTGDTSDTNIINALNYAIGLNNGLPGTIDIINMSLGGGNYSNQAACDADGAAYVAAFAALNAQGTSIFVATGNDAQIGEISSPACITGAIGVGSVGDAAFTANFSACTDNGQPDKVSCFSNATPVQGAGELVDLMAPGCAITSTGLDGATDVQQCGTSMATPYAAGTAALALEKVADKGTTITPAALETLLEDTGVPVTDYRMVDSPTFPRVSPPAAIGSLSLAAPAGLVVTASTSNSVSLNWGAAAGAAKYQIYVSVRGGTASLLGETTAPTRVFTHTPIACGQLTYTVRASDGTFQSSPSNGVSITKRICPAAPTDLEVTASGTSAFDISWKDSNTNESSLLLQRSTNSGGYVDVGSFLPGASFATTDSGLSCGIYRYRVVAVRNGDSSTPATSAPRGLCAPANDDQAAAEVVTPGVSYVDTEPGASYATSEATDPIYQCHFGAPGAGFNGVWYSVTPTSAARVTVSTASTTIFDPGTGAPDTLLAIYDTNTTQPVACNDDISNANFRSTASAVMQPGKTYLVFVSQWVELPIGTTGDLVTSFTFEDAVDNDLIEDARVMTTFPAISTVTNAQRATVSASDPNHTCGISGGSVAPRVGNHTMWWTFTPPYSGKLDLDTFASSGSFTDTLLSVMSGTPGALTSVACNDDTAPGFRSKLVDVQLTGGTTYYVYVSRWSTTATATAGTVVLNSDFTVDPGVAVEPSTVHVSEDGLSGSYDVRLLTAPTADVTISVTPDAQCDTDISQVDFSPANYSEPQTVTVSAVTDADFTEGQHTCTITHAATSTDGIYNGIAVVPVTGTVEDAILATAAITTPAEGASFVQGTTVAADFACTDNKAGAAIASCVGSVADGAAIDTATVGAKTFTVTVTDTLGTATEVTTHYTVTAPPPSPLAKPDARVKKGKSGKLIGNDIYGTKVGQTVKGSARARQSVTYQVSIQNDATFADTFSVKGGGSGNGFTVKYTDKFGNDITRAVKKGTYRTAKLAPGAASTLNVKVTVTKKASKAKPLTRSVTATSRTQKTKTDAVTIVTSRR